MNNFGDLEQEMIYLLEEDNADRESVDVILSFLDSEEDDTEAPFCYRLAQSSRMCGE